MRVIEGVEVVSSGNGGGGACHNDKPGRRNDKVPPRTHKAYVQCGLRRFPHEGFRWCWFHEPPYTLPLLRVWSQRSTVFLALCCLGKIPGGAPFSQLHKSGNGSRVDRP